MRLVRFTQVLALTAALGLAGCLTGNVSMKDAEYRRQNNTITDKITGNHLVTSDSNGFRIKIVFKQNDCLPTFDEDNSFQNALLRMTKSALEEMFLSISATRVDKNHIDTAIKQQYTSINRIKIISYIGLIKPTSGFSLIGGTYTLTGKLRGFITSKNDQETIIERHLNIERNSHIDLKAMPKRYNRNCVQFVGNKISEALTQAISTGLNEWTRNIQEHRYKFSPKPI